MDNLHFVLGTCNDTLNGKLRKVEEENCLGTKKLTVARGKEKDRGGKALKLAPLTCALHVSLGLVVMLRRSRGAPTLPRERVWDRS